MCGYWLVYFAFLFLQKIKNRVVIYVHPFENNFDDNLVFLSFYWSKPMEREKEREMKRT